MLDTLLGYILSSLYSWPQPLGDIATQITLILFNLLSIPGLLITLNLILLFKSSKGTFQRIVAIKLPDKTTFLHLVGAKLFIFGLWYAFPMPWSQHQPFPVSPVNMQFLATNHIGEVFKSISAYLFFAFAEEFMFRSYILFEGRRRNLLLTSALLLNFVFAFEHSGIVPQFISGIAFTWIVLRQNSIGFATLIHFSWNIFVMMWSDITTAVLPEAATNFIMSEHGALAFGITLMLCGAFSVFLITKDVIRITLEHERLPSLLKVLSSVLKAWLKKFREFGLNHTPDGATPADPSCEDKR